MRKRLLIVGLILSSTFVYGQQDAMVSQYVFNGLFVNPAYAGSHSYYSSTLIHRDQWVKMEGAPRTSMISLDGPLRKETMGAGLYLANDEIGVTKQTDIYANYAYHLKLTKESKLAFGVRLGASHYAAKVSELTVWDNGDNVFASDRKGEFVPKLGFGAYYYTKMGFLGLSAPTVVAYEKEGSKVDLEKSSAGRRHYYLTGGYVFPFDQANLKLKPSFLLKYHPAAPLEADLNVHALLRDALWLGVGYRTGDAIVGMLEFQVTRQLRLGYAYDYTTSMLSRYTSGTHELLIGYDFYKERIKAKTPRYF